MKIALAQIAPIRGEVLQNIDKHLAWVEAADADMVVFPELSLTAYEPSLAGQLATSLDDPRLEPFQHTGKIVCVGMPVQKNIGMIIFQPGKPRELYTKQYLHEDELPFFEPGVQLNHSLNGIGLAICYELSIPEHALRAYQSGAGIYIASVAKTAKGIEKASGQLQEIARRYAMTVLVCNSVGICEDGECAGRSAIWNNKGHLLAQLNDTEEGLLYCHT